MNNLADILGIVSEVYGVYEEALVGSGRPDLVVEARHAFCYMGSQLGYTQDAIAAVIGRERSGISHAVISFQARIDCDPRAHEKYLKLREGMKKP